MDIKKEVSDASHILAKHYILGSQRKCLDYSHGSSYSETILTQFDNETSNSVIIAQLRLYRIKNTIFYAIHLDVIEVKRLKNTQCKRALGVMLRSWNKIVFIKLLC